MKKVLFIAAIALLMTSCFKTKNEAAIKKLDGTWKATQYSETIDGATIDLIALGMVYQLTFENDCDLEKKDQWCTLIITKSFDGETATKNWVYRAESDASILIWKDQPGSQNPITYFVKNLEKTSLTLQLIDDGVITDIVLEKQ